MLMKQRCLGPSGVPRAARESDTDCAMMYRRPRGRWSTRSYARAWHRRLPLPPSRPRRCDGGQGRRLRAEVIRGGRRSRAAGRSGRHVRQAHRRPARRRPGSSRVTAPGSPRTPRRSNAGGSRRRRARSRPRRTRRSARASARDCRSRTGASRAAGGWRGFRRATPAGPAPRLPVRSVTRAPLVHPPAQPRRPSYAAPPPSHAAPPPLPRSPAAPPAQPRRPSCAASPPLLRSSATLLCAPFGELRYVRAAPAQPRHPSCAPVCVSYATDRSLLCSLATPPAQLRTPPAQPSTPPAHTFPCPAQHFPPPAHPRQRRGPLLAARRRARRPARLRGTPPLSTLKPGTPRAT